MEQAVVRIRKGSGRSFKEGGAWIYNNEIDSVSGNFQNGDLVLVEDFDGYFLGTGFINENSAIRVRMMSRIKGQKIDEAFIEQRVRAAVKYRADMGYLKELSGGCRLIFGEADFLPGIVVDRFADILVVQSLALGIDRLKEQILEKCRKVLLEYGITVRGIFERSDAKVRINEGMPQIKGFLGQEFNPKVEITENGVHYYVDVAEGQKTGFFLDQKYNRLAVQRFCKDAEVLDCFTHTGSFALNAGVAGAKRVTGVDASETAVRQAEENARLNHLEDRVSFLCEDVFELLPKLEAEHKKYDVVILDPPAFTKSRNSVKNAVKGYREINMRGIKLVKNGGYLATCSCSHFMEPELFAKTIAQAAKSVHRRLRQVEYRTQASDHPILWAADESYYLKFYIFQVCEEK